MHLILIGMRGSGKTTVGRRVSQLLDRPFIDIDERIANQAGQTIAQIFAARGEAGFRTLESAAIIQAIAEPPAVISVGGGAILSAANRDCLRGGGYCIWLRASLQTLAARIAADPATPSLRPPLAGGPPAEELRALSIARDPLYLQTARETIDTDLRPVEELAELVIRAFQSGTGS